VVIEIVKIKLKNYDIIIFVCRYPFSNWCAAPNQSFFSLDSVGLGGDGISVMSPNSPSSSRSHSMVQWLRNSARNSRLLRHKSSLCDSMW